MNEQHFRVEKTTVHTIKIEPSLWAFAKEVGAGNATAGIRFVLTQMRNRIEARNREDAERGTDPTTP